MDSFRLLVQILLLGSLVETVYCNIFVSNKLLNDAVIRAKTETNELKELLKGYIDEQLKRMERAEGLIQELHDLSGDEIKDTTFKMTHPFNAYRFIRNHSDIFNSSLMDAVAEISSFENDTLSIWKTNLTDGLASMTDFNGTIVAFSRLQNTYNISTEDFADGSFIDAPESKLTGDECRDVSTLMELHKHHARGLEWLKEAKHRKRLGKCDSAAVEGLLRVAARSALKTGNLFAAMNAIGGGSQAKYIDRKTQFLANRIQTGLEKYKASAKPKEVEKLKDEANTIRIKHPEYNNLCSRNAIGNGHLLNKKDKLLSCRYDTNGQPYLMIQPVKYEQLSSKPYIVVYHDVFTDTDIQAMTNETKDRLKRSFTGQITAYGSQPAGRISASAPMLKGSTSNMLIDKVKTITSLQAGGEYLQVINYGVGGYYAVHHDGVKTVENDRIATVMVYMTDVEMGGATIFPNANLTVFPKKGSAVLWHNMYRNVTTVDNMASHSACPVLKGDKWVTTFLIREYGQEFRLPCTLNEFE